MPDIQLQTLPKEITRVWWRTEKGMRWVYNNMDITDTDRLCGYFIVPSEHISDLKKVFIENELDVD